MQEILTLEEVAKYLRISERTVSDWAAKGKIPGGKIGTSWRFKKGDVEDWVNNQISLSPPKNSGIAIGELSKILTIERTVILDSTNKIDALNEMIDLFKDIPGLKNREMLSESIFNREKLMSTGIGLSIAVPHVRLNSVKNLYMALGITKNAISDYESIDKVPVRILVMIVAGKTQQIEYIKTLSRISRILRNQQVRKNIICVKNPVQLFQAFIEEDQKI